MNLREKWIACTLGVICLTTLGLTFHFQPGGVASLGHWAPAATWDSVLRLQWNLGAAFYFCAGCAVFAVASFLERADRLIFIPLLALALIAGAESAELVLLGWCILGLRSFLARSSSAVQLSQVCLFFCILLLHAIFKTTDLSEIVRLSQQPYDYDPHLLVAAWATATAAAILPTYAYRPTGMFWTAGVAPLFGALWLSHVAFLPPHIPYRSANIATGLLIIPIAASVISLFERDAFQVRQKLSRICTITLLASTPFLGAHALGYFALALSACLIALISVDKEETVAWKKAAATTPALWGVALCLTVVFQGTLISTYFRVGLGLVATLVTASLLRCIWIHPSLEAELKAPVVKKKYRQFLSIPATALRKFDTHFWPGVWHMPAQACRSFGLFFDFWQSGTPQYTLLVLLIGSLILFWAALKTQVMW